MTDTDVQLRGRAEARATRQKLVDRVVRFSWPQQLAYNFLMAVVSAAIVYWMSMNLGRGDSGVAGNYAVITLLFVLVAKTVQDVGQRVDAITTILRRSGALVDFVEGGNV